MNSSSFSVFLFTIFTVIKASLSSLYLLDGDVAPFVKEQAYHRVLLENDYPMCLSLNEFPPSQRKIDEKLQEIHPDLHSIWVPTALFQLYVVERFFSDDLFRDYVQKLGYNHFFYKDDDPYEVTRFNAEKAKGDLWSLYVDEKVIATFEERTSTLSNLREVYSRINHRSDLSSLFVKMNDGFLKSYVPGIEKIWLRSIPTELEEWSKYRFPFLFSPYAQVSMDALLAVFKECPQVIFQVIESEKKAYAEECHLVYRGAEITTLEMPTGETLPLLFLPLNCKRKGDGFVFNKGMSSFSLSYGNSLFGGFFISTDACALRYAISNQPFPYAFHAIKLNRMALVEDSLFCVPPLHPFVEMFTDGEWFHPHTRIVPRESNRLCYGWYAKINRFFNDTLGFIMRRDCTPEGFGAKLLSYAAQQAEILHTTFLQDPLNMENHEKAAEFLNAF